MNGWSRWSTLPRSRWWLAWLALHVALAVQHALGGRDATAALAGVVSTPIEVAQGLAYVATWLCVIIAAPAFILAAALSKLIERRLGAGKTGLADA